MPSLLRFLRGLTLFDVLVAAGLAFSFLAAVGVAWCVFVHPHIASGVEIRP